MKHLFSLFCLALALTACGSSEKETRSAGPLTADLRAAIGEDAGLRLDERVRSVEYIPLEATDDDASLIGGITDFAITDRHIYVYPQTEPRIVLFDRQGHFVRTLIREGQGPGEFSGALSGIQAVPEENRLYLFGDKTWVYTLDGKYISSTLSTFPTLFRRRIATNRFARVAMPFVPFSQGSYGIGVADSLDAPVWNKNDFSAPGLEADRMGFTGSVAACLATDGRSVLFKSGCNDTVYRLTPDSVAIACVIRTDNSDEEKRRALDITDFANLQGAGRSPRELFVSDIMDTPSAFYFRCRYDEGYTVFSVDKRTGEARAERCDMPVDNLQELAASSTYQLGLLGSRSYGDFPIWGRTEGRHLIQVVAPTELSLYQERLGITIPEPLRTIDEEANPVFVIYELGD